MLTALSVARECHIVEQQEKVILVQAFPPQTDKSGNTSSPPQIEYVYTDEVSQASDNNSPKQYIVCIVFCSEFHLVSVCCAVYYKVHLRT